MIVTEEGANFRSYNCAYVQIEILGNKKTGKERDRLQEVTGKMKTLLFTNDLIRI